MDLHRGLKTVGIMTLVESSEEVGEISVIEDDLQSSPVMLSSRAPTLDPGPQPSHQRLVFADPSAFRYTDYI